MFRTASSSLARRRCLLSSSTPSSSSLIHMNHQNFLHSTSNLLQTSITVNTNIMSSNHTSKAQPSQSYVLLNSQGMIYHPPLSWNTKSNQRRLLSTNNHKTEGKSGDNADSLGKNLKHDGNDTQNDLMFGLDQKRILIGLGIFSVGTAIMTLPVVTRYMHQVEQEYEEDEVEVDEELYQRMKDISAEVEGEITKGLLGEELSKKLIEGGKKKAVDNTVSLFTDVVNSEALQNAISTMLSNIVTSSQFQRACQMVVKNLWDDLVSDPETTAQVVALLNTAIKDERIKSSFKELIIGLLRDEDVKRELTSLVVQLGNEQEVLDATRELLTESAHRALNDPEILDHSMEFATDVVGDNVLQRTSGEALRNTVTYAVKPSLSTFLSVFGIALLFFSASALGKARMSAREGREIDAAASVVAKSISNTFVSKISKILSIPVKAVSGLTSAIVATLMFPFQLIGRAAGAVVSAGNVAVSTVLDIFTKATSFPAFVQEIVLMSLSSLKVSLSKLSQQSSTWVAFLPGVLLSKTKIWLSAAGIFIKNGLQNGGTKLYSSAVSILISTGTSLSNMLNSLLKKSRSTLDNAGKQILLTLSDVIGSLLSIFRGSTNI